MVTELGMLRTTVLEERGVAKIPQDTGIGKGFLNSIPVARKYSPKLKFFKSTQSINELNC